MSVVIENNKRGPVVKTPDGVQVFPKGDKGDKGDRGYKGDPSTGSILSDEVLRIKVMTQLEYDNLSPKIDTTLYIII